MFQVYCYRVNTTSYLHKPITVIPDKKFQTLIDEIYHCAGWVRNDQQFSNLFSLLNALLLQDRKSFTAAFLPGPEHVLTTRVLAGNR